MKYGYRIMMTERCEIPENIPIKPGCTEGFSEAPYLVDEIVYYSLEDAEEVLSKYKSLRTGAVTDSSFKRIYGVREFYIEKIKLGEYDRKLKSYGAVKYADFEVYEKGKEPVFCSDPPQVVKWCRRKNYCGPVEESIAYKGKRTKNEKNELIQCT